MADRLTELEWERTAINAFKAIFQGPFSETVMSDLEHFSKINATSFGDNPHEQTKIVGRIEMLNWMRHRINTNTNQIRQIDAEINKIKESGNV